MRKNSLETIQQSYSKVVQMNEGIRECVPHFRMSEKDIISIVELDSEIDNPLLKKYRIKHERKSIILRSALYGFLKDELWGASCIVGRKDSRLKIPQKYFGNLNQLKKDFRVYLNNKIIEGRYI